MGEIKCVRGHLVQALNSAAGWYVGTIDEDGFPYCRISQGYYKTCKDAEDAIKNGTYTQRTCIENQFCNSGMGCFNIVNDTPIDRQYIIVHTRYGYLSKVGDGLLSDFSKDIADAVTFTNFEQVKTLCNTYMACAWMREGDNPYRPCYEPSNKFNTDTLDEIRRTMYAK